MREIFIDVENGSNNTIKVTQGDNLTESYKLIITENKIRLDLTNKKVKFAFVKSDSHYGDIIEELKILNAIEGEVEFEVVNRITKVDGLYSCGLAVYDDKGFLEHTGTFSLYVRESIFEKVSGELIKNSAYKELISLLDRATNLNKEIDPIVINAEEKTNTLKDNIKVADNSNKTLVDNTEKANTLNNTLVENTNEAKKTNEDAVIKDNTLKETIKAAEANSNKLIHTNDSAKEINNTLVKNMNEVKEVNENAINIKTSLENNINQATNLKIDLETEINKSVLANNTLIKSIDNATETNKDFINKDSNLKETIKNAENINEELSENENKATLNEATRKKNEAERIEAEKIREEKIQEFGLQVNKNKNDIADNSKDIERAFETINDNSFITFTGENISVEHSKVGFTKDMKLEGMTYKNIIPKGFNSYKLLHSDFVVDNNKITMIGKGGYPSIVYKDFNFKPDTIYTLIVNVLKLDNIQQEDWCIFRVGEGDGKANVQVPNPTKVGLYITKFTTLESTPIDAQTFLRPQTNGKTIILSDLIILEGDHSNSYIPPYFEGIKSVGAVENKLKILSHCKNFYNGNYINSYFSVDHAKLTSSIDSVMTLVLENLSPGNYKVVGNNDRLCIGYTNSKPINGLIFDYVEYFDSLDNFIIKHNYKYVCLYVSSNKILENIMVVKQITNEEYEPYKQDKKEILLPFAEGLKGIPNGAKDVVVDNKIIQRVGKHIFTGSVEEGWHLENAEGFKRFSFYSGIKDSKTSPAISNNFVFDTSDRDYEHFKIGAYGTIYVYYKKENPISLLEFKKWLQQNPLEIYYELADPIEHKITDLNSINLETFKDVTYVSSENEIQPNLSFKAPVDIPATISTLKAANTMLIAQNVGLENKNKQLEKVNNKQTEKINQLDEATTALISSALM